MNTIVLPSTHVTPNSPSTVHSQPRQVHLHVTGIGALAVHQLMQPFLGLVFLLQLQVALGNQ